MRKNILGAMMLFILLLSSCSMVAEHEWSPWVTTKEATCMEDGEKTSTCVLCDETKTEKIAKLSHKLDDNNKCTLCGHYHVLSSAGKGDSLAAKLKTALDSINSSSASSAVLYLEGGEYDLSQIENELTITASNLTIHGSSNGTKTTFKVPSSKSLSVTGDSFSLDNVAFTLDDDQSSSSSLLSLRGDNATIKNTSFDMNSNTTVQAIGDIAENKSVTLDGVTINGGGTLKSKGTLSIENSTINTSIQGENGELTIQKSTIDGNLTTAEDVTKLLIEDSTVKNGAGALKGSEVAIKSSNITSTSLSIDSKSATITDESTISSDSITIKGSSEGSTATIENSTITGKTVEISSETNTITNSNINKGNKDNSLTIGGKTAEISSSVLDGKVTIESTESTTIKDNSAVNSSSTKDGGSFVVKDGTVEISQSRVGGNITFEKGVKNATIASSSIDTSDGTNSLITGTSLEIKDSTITKGSGLYVNKDANSIAIEINDSKVADGNNTKTIETNNVTDVFSKDVPDAKKSTYIKPWESGSTASFKIDDNFTSVSFKFIDSNNNETSVNVGKAGDKVNLNDIVTQNMTGYVSPTFYTDSAHSNAIKDSTITIVDGNKYKTSNGGDTTYENIYVAWEFNVSYKDGNDTVQTATTTEGGKFTLATPTKIGYVFVGWQYEDGTTLTTTKSDDGNSVTATLKAPSTLIPIWHETHTVTFNANGGNLTKNTIEVEDGKTIAATDKPSPTHNQYTFDKWCTDEACTKPFDFKTTITGPITLYAKWKVVVTITDSAGKTTTYEGDTDSGVALSKLTKPSEVGFEGWYTDKSCTTKASDPMKENKTLYPAYKVTLNLTKDESIKEEKEKELKVVYGKTITATGFFNEEKKDTKDNEKNTYISKTDKYFAGWYNGDTKITADTVIKQGMTLKAKWNVSYILDDKEELIAEGSAETKVSVETLTSKKKENRPWVKTVTWYVDGGTTGYTTGTIDITKAGQELTYKEDYYLPELNSNPTGINAGTPTGILGVDGTTGELTLPTYSDTSNGYHFEGWYNGDDKFGTDQYKTSLNNTMNWNITLTPVWSKTFTIKYSTGSEGSLSGNNPTSYTRYYGNDNLNTTTLTLPTPTTTYSYTFGGWKINDSDTSGIEVISKDTDLTNVSGKELSLSAYWKINPVIRGTLIFGTYNSKPLEWIIIGKDESNNRVLLLSKYALEPRLINDSTSTYSWPASTLRAWLNDDTSSSTDTSNDKFLKKYGLTDVYKNIIEVTNTTKRYTVDSSSKEFKEISSASDTSQKDKIFILSYEEYMTYIYNTNGVKNCQTTTWIDSTSGGTVSWWLRSAKNNNSTLALGVIGANIYDTNNKVLKSETVADVNNTNGVHNGDLGVRIGDRFIRPAFWYGY